MQADSQGKEQEDQEDGQHLTDSHPPDVLRAASSVGSAHRVRDGGIDAPAGDQPAAQRMQEVLEEGERAADADDALVVGGRPI